jgi:2-polyprenyl-6-methoxyphenol hydroxylase-like FAD-dependent oxidoreductase
MSDVSILGTGRMGAALARTLLGAGLEVCVWNRTPSKSEPLLRDGARRADSPAEAVRASALTVALLSDYDAVLEVLDFMGVETNKRYHLGDGLNAVYRHTGYDDFIARLEGYGFGNPRRLTGGFPTDFDHDVIDADPWGRQKFGDGDIRVLVQKL